MAFKKSNSSAGEEFAARKRPALGPKDQIDVNDIATLKYCKCRIPSTLYGILDIY